MTLWKADNIPHPIPIPNNMGIIRYILAFIIVVVHFSEALGLDIPTPIDGRQAVGAFFALSGFLVYSSFMKKRHAGHYFSSRAWRILPAYVTVIVFSAILLAPLSTLPAGEYFTSAHFWKYLAANLSFCNFLEPTLPGLFEHNWMPAVNGSLWTMKVEWFLYASVPVVAFAIRRWKWKATSTFVVIYILSSLYSLGFYLLYRHSGTELFNILSRQFMGQMLYFYSGVLIYYYFSTFMRHRVIITVISIAVIIANRYLPYCYFITDPVAIASLTLAASFSFKASLKEGTNDNVSYNIYLIHFPVLQTFIMLGLFTVLGRWLGFAAYCLTTVLLSIIVNRLVERPLTRRYRST